MSEIDFRDEIIIPGFDDPIIIEFNDDTNSLLIDVYDALLVSRSLTGAAQVDIAHPYVIMLMSVFEYEADKAVPMAQTLNQQFLDAAMNDAYLVAMCWSNFKINPKFHARVEPIIPTDLPANWWTNQETNDRRIGLGTLPLPEPNPNSAAEVRVAYLKEWQKKYPEFRGASLQSMKQAVSKYIVNGLREAKKVDEAGFRSGDVDRDLDGAAGADHQEGEAAGLYPSALPRVDEISGRYPEGRKQGTKKGR